MEALIVEFRIHPQHILAFERAIADNAHRSRTLEPGCQQFDVCRDAAEPALFFLYELYDDEAAVQLHLRSPHFLEMDQLTRDWVVHKSVRRMRRQSP